MTHPALLPIAAFALSIALTISIRKASARSPTEFNEKTSAPHQHLRTKPHREQNAFSGIRAFLRAGDLDGAKAAMRELAERDAFAFFELLERLPGFPGIEDIIQDAAGRLAWNEPEVVVLLNRIVHPDSRLLAWEAYTASKIGVLPDAEVFEVGTRARCHVSLGGYRALMEDAAEHRPGTFLAMLNHMGSTGIREEFFEMLIKNHPEHATELYHTIPDGSPGCNYDRAYVLQVRSRCLPTAENLIATLHDLGDRGPYSNTFASLFTHQTYRHASEDERGKVLETIAAQPALARNRMLPGILLYDNEPLPPADFSRVVGIYTSGHLQRDALSQWLEKQPDLSLADRGWIDQLPNDALKEKANALLDARAEGKVTDPSPPPAPPR